MKGETITCFYCGSVFVKKTDRSNFCKKTCRDMHRRSLLYQERITHIKSNELELWQPILGFENLYEISSFGRILSHHCYNLLTPCNNGTGYLYFTPRLHKEETKIHLYIHRIVAIHFLPNPNELPEVNHKNGNKWDNRVENLEWCTRKENQIHASINGLLQTGADRPNACKVIDTKTGKVYDTIKQFAVENNITYGLAKEAMNRKAERRTHRYKGIFKLSEIEMKVTESKQKGLSEIRLK